MSSTSAVVFDIQRNSFQDGPGIRTTVFLKGCCMRCSWCHNPESFETAPRTATLPNGIVKTWGRTMTAADAFEHVKADTEFYRASEGGVTLSGGEPAMFPDFCADLFGFCREAGIHTAIETNGVPDWKNFVSFIGLTDLFLFDYKLTDPESHRRWTGSDRSLVMETLEKIAMAKKNIVLRCPIIPGVNDDDGHLRAIADLVRRFGCTAQLLPFHATAADKWKALGLKNAFEGKPSMTPAEGETILARIKALGCPADKISLP